jgi:hypothetical protein
VERERDGTVKADPIENGSRLEYPLDAAWLIRDGLLDQFLSFVKRGLRDVDTYVVPAS